MRRINIKKLRIFLAFTILVMLFISLVKLAGPKVIPQLFQAHLWVKEQAQLQLDNKSDYNIVKTYMEKNELKGTLLIISSDKFSEEGLPELPYDVVFHFYENGKERYCVVRDGELIDVGE